MRQHCFESWACFRRYSQFYLPSQTRDLESTRNIFYIFYRKLVEDINSRKSFNFFTKTSKWAIFSGFRFVCYVDPQHFISYFGVNSTEYLCHDFVFKIQDKWLYYLYKNPITLRIFYNIN